MILARAAVEIFGDTSRLNQALQRAAADLTAFGRRMEGVTGRISTGFAGPIALGLQRVQNQLGGFGRRMEGVGRELSTKLTLPMIAAGGSAIHLANDFDRSMSLIEGLVGINRRQVEAWAKEIIALAPQVGKMPNELAQGLYFVTSSGLDTAHAMDVLTVSARAATAGLGDTQVIAQALTSVMNAYGVANIDAAQGADILTAAVREGKIEADEMTPVLGRLLPTASALGIKFEQVAGIIAVFSRTGLNAAEASTSVNAILSTLLKPAAGAQKALAGVGLSMAKLREAAAGPNGIITVMRLLDEAFGSNEDALAKIFPNVRAFRGVMNALSQDAAAVDEVMAGVANATGSADVAFQAAANTGRFKVNVTLAEMQGQLILLGRAIGPLIFAIGGQLVSALTAVTTWFGRQTSGLQKFIIAVGAATVALGPLLIVLASLARALATLKILLLASAFATWAANVVYLISSIRNLGSALAAVQLAMGPTGWIVLGVTAIVAAFALWTKRTREQKKAQDELTLGLSVYRKALTQVGPLTLQTQLTTTERDVKIQEQVVATLRRRRDEAEEVRKETLKARTQDDRRREFAPLGDPAQVEALTRELEEQESVLARLRAVYDATKEAVESIPQAIEVGTVKEFEARNKKQLQAVADQEKVVEALEEQKKKLEAALAPPTFELGAEKLVERTVDPAAAGKLELVTTALNIQREALRRMRLEQEKTAYSAGQFPEVLDAQIKKQKEAIAVLQAQKVALEATPKIKALGIEVLPAETVEKLKEVTAAIVTQSAELERLKAQRRLVAATKIDPETLTLPTPGAAITEPVKDALAQYNAAIREAEILNEALGKSYDFVGAKAQATESLISDLAATGITMASTARFQGKTVRDYGEELADLTAQIDAQKKAEDEARAIEEEGKRVRESLLTPTEKYDAFVERLNRHGKEWKLTQEQITRAEQDAADERDEAIARGDRLTRSQRRALELNEELGTAQQRYNIAIAELDELQKQLTPEAYAEGVRRAKEELFAATIAASSFKQVAADLFFAATDAIAAFATGAKDAFKRFVQSALADLARLAIRILAIKALMALFPGSSFVGALGAAVGLRPSGAKKHGGPVEKHQSYLVGEAGPELFVPKSMRNFGAQFVASFAGPSKTRTLTSVDNSRTNIDSGDATSSRFWHSVSNTTDQSTRNQNILDRSALNFIETQSRTEQLASTISRTRGDVVDSVINSFQTNVRGASSRTSGVQIVGGDGPTIFVPERAGDIITNQSLVQSLGNALYAATPPSAATIKERSEINLDTRGGTTKRTDLNPLEYDRQMLLDVQRTESYLNSEERAFSADSMSTFITRTLLKDLEFRRDGGPVAATRPYIVGEQGPELFVPSTAGRVVSNKQLVENSQSMAVTLRADLSNLPPMPTVLPPELAATHRWYRDLISHLILDYNARS